MNLIKRLTMDYMCDLSFITVNFNGQSDTFELINSIINVVKSVSYEVIVVDNGSKVDEATQIKERYLSYNNVIVIRSEKNLGFAGGNNLGVRVAKGRYVMLINNDTIVPNDSYSQILDYMRDNPDVGCVSPKILFYEPSGTIQFAGYTPLSNITIRNRLIGFGEHDNSQYDTISDTPYCHGAAMIIPSKVIDSVGLMSELYFLYYEELDWCTAIGESGFKLKYVPVCSVIHKESRSTGQGSPLRTYYITRNRLLYTWRHRKGLVLFLSICYQICVAAPKAIAVNILKRRFDLLKPIIKGVLDFVKFKNKCEVIWR